MKEIVRKIFGEDEANDPEIIEHYESLHKQAIEEYTDGRVLYLINDVLSIINKPTLIGNRMIKVKNYLETIKDVMESREAFRNGETISHEDFWKEADIHPCKID